MKFLLSLFVVVCAAFQVNAQVVPEKALATFKTSPGLEVTLWASEPLCVNPTCMDIDHKGRVWYSESINYRQKLRGEKKMRRPEGDCIVILEDTKGEGKADKRTIFYQSPAIHAPLGIAVAPYPDGKGQKVYVCQSPDILVFEDKDGDLKADGPPTKLLTGFRGIDHDHGVHGIIIGPDNKLYFTVGDSGVENLQSSDGKGRKWTSNNTDCRAGTVWRCDLDGKNLELIAHNFRNNYEACVDSFGTVFLSDNDDDGQDQVRICYVMPGGNYGYHRNPKTSHWNEEHPGIVPKILRTGRGSPTGICMYEGTLLPKKYQGQILHVDAGPGRLSCYHIKPKGAGYEVEREDMLTSTDSWFRPSDVTVAPDGAVFVCDWYDPGVGGHGVGDFTRGRIYRIAPQGNMPIVPDPQVNNQDGVLKAMASPNLAVRAMGMARINSESSEAFKIGTLMTMTDGREPNWRRARGYWLYGQLYPMGNGRGKEDIFQALRDVDPLVRLIAQRDLHDFYKISPLDYRDKMNSVMLNDHSPAVRREILLLLQHADPAKAKATIYSLAKQYDGKDRFYLAAIGIAVGAPGISKEIDERRAVILADFDKHFPEWNDKVAGLVWELRPPGVVPLLQKQLATGKLTPAQRLQIVEMLAGSNDPSAYQVMLRALLSETSAEVRDRIIAILKTNLSGTWSAQRTSKDLDTAIDQLLKEPATRAAGFALIGEARKTTFLKQATEAAENVKEGLAVRHAALAALGKLGNVPGGFFSKIALDKEAPEELRIEAVKAGGGDPSWLTLHLPRLVQETKDYSLALRQAAVATMAGDKKGSEFLLKSIKDKQVAQDLIPDLTRLLRNSPFPHIKKEAQSVLPAPPKLDPKKLPSIAALATRKGNALRGELVLTRSLKTELACLKCHTVQGAGGNAGPDLSTIGSKASRENLLESILYPSKAINHQYDTWIVETQQGQIITGILAQETADFIVLRDANVKDYKIAVKNIAEKKKSPVSLMPDNLLLYMSEEELIDLVEYLYSLKTFAPMSRRQAPTHRLAVTARPQLLQPLIANSKQNKLLFHHENYTSNRGRG